jgi:DNA-binding NarL/FixJ family response regulator
MNGAEARRLAEFFKVLGSPARLRSLHALAVHGELQAAELATIVGSSTEAVRGDMQRLVRAGIVARRRDGRSFVYGIARPSTARFLSHSAAAAGLGPDRDGEGRSDDGAQSMIRRLTSLGPRQREVLELLGEGVSAEDIAARLGITEATARSHIHAILAALGARSQLAAVTLARRHGFVL